MKERLCRVRAEKVFIQVTLPSVHLGLDHDLSITRFLTYEQTRIWHNCVTRITPQRPCRTSKEIKKDAPDTSPLSGPVRGTRVQATYAGAVASAGVCSGAVLEL